MLDHPAALDVGTPQALATLLAVLTIGVGVLVANLLVSTDIGFIRAFGARQARYLAAT